MNRNYPQEILGFLLGTVFPVRCIECGEFSSEKNKNYLCKKCLKLIPVRNNFECIGCKRPGNIGKTCFECRNEFAIDQLLVVSDYQSKTLQKAIKNLKYRFIPEIAGSFYSIIKKYIVWLEKEKDFSLLSDNSIIFPIPLHNVRFNFRGFNQSELIAQTLADITLSKVTIGLLTRTKNTKPQAETRELSERIGNTAEIFNFTSQDSIQGKNIILVDDVCTSGATLNEAGKVLKKNGAEKVIGFVIARG